MKTKIILAIVFCIVFLLIIGLIAFSVFTLSCGLLENKMCEYYSDDNNYQQVRGVVTETVNEHVIVVEILSDSEDFIKYGNKVQFEICSNESVGRQIMVGDNIEFISAPKYFYNGNKLPIVQIVLDDIEYLDFLDGKEFLLEKIVKAKGG